MNKYIYIIGICVILSGCSMKLQNRENINNTLNININSGQDIGYTGEEYIGLENETTTGVKAEIDNNQIINTGSILGNATGLAKTNKIDLYMTPPYEPGNNCNREARKTFFDKKDIYLMVLNCNFENGQYTINASGNTWTEDKYIGSSRSPELEVIKMFTRKNTKNFDEIDISIPKGCVLKKVNEDNNFEEREILTTGDYTKIAEEKILVNNSYLPCGEYGYTAIGRRWFIVAKSSPNIVFSLINTEEMSLFDFSTLLIK